MAALQLPAASPPPQSHSYTGATETSFGRSVRDSNPVLLPSLDRYRLSCLLGRGGMAEVFLAAWQVAPQVIRPVVVKRLYSHFSDEQPLVRMFIDEARLVCQLDHEHIVKTYEIGLIDGRLCIVMEYLEGQTLQQLIRGTSEPSSEPVGLPIPLAVYIARSVLAGLKYAHESKDCHGHPNEIVHRDISPQNIFITNSGQVKLLDFGIAKAKSQESRTSTGIVKGKFAYIAPEQALGQPVDGRADVFSLGVVLWEALVGQRLFKADGDAATLNATLKREVPFLTSVRPEIPLDVATAVNRALQRDPKKRYACATAMLADLEKYLGRLTRRPCAESLGMHMHARFGNEIRLQQQRVRELTVLHEAQSERAATQSQPPISSETIVDSDMSPGSGASLVQGETLPTRPGYWPLLVALAGLVVVLTVACVLLWRTSASQAPLTLGQSLVPKGSRAVLESRVGTQTVPSAQAAQQLASNTGQNAEVTAPAIIRTSQSTPPKDGSASVRAIAASPGKRTVAKSEKVKGIGGAVEPVVRIPVAEVPVAVSSVEFGGLTIDTTPWSFVSIKGKLLGATPIIQARLPAGTHILSLKNPELGLETQYTVNIQANQTVTRRIGLK